MTISAVAAMAPAKKNAGHDTRALQAWLGHENIQHTVRYTELAPDRFKNFLALTVALVGYWRIRTLVPGKLGHPLAARVTNWVGLPPH
jgi:hypothetical protein